MTGAGTTRDVQCVPPLIRSNSSDCPRHLLRSKLDATAMSADGRTPLSIVDMLLNDTSTLDVFDKPAVDDDAEVSRYRRADVCFSSDSVASRPSTGRTYSSLVCRGGVRPVGGVRRVRSRTVRTRPESDFDFLFFRYNHREP